MQKIIFLHIGVIFISLFTSVVCADILKLKSGEEVEGQIVEQTADLIRVNIGMDAPVVYYQDEVESVQESAWPGVVPIRKENFTVLTKETKEQRIHKLLNGNQELPTPQFELHLSGLNRPLNYFQYGDFKNLGKDNYRYEISKAEQLRKDLGAGIFPNYNAVREDPNYQKYKQRNKLKRPHWKALKLRDKQRAFYIWTQAAEEPGVKSFFIGQILEEAGHIVPAIKSYYAAIVHFPKSAGWAENKSFVYYIAPTAMASIKRLLRDYPQIGYDYVGSKFSIQNGDDTDLKNDIIRVVPGRFVKRDANRKRIDLAQMPVIKRRGGKHVEVVQYKNGHWQLFKKGKPFFIQGISYHPTTIGLGPHSDELYESNWMFSDKNKNGQIDAAYDSWVDRNRNNKQDKDEPAVGDFQLLKGMGVNAIRMYIPNRKKTLYDPKLVNKPLLRDLYNRFGISVIAGDFLGAYTVGSGASWTKGTDYRDKKQRRRMKSVVRQKVMDLKDEEFVLFWLLGNENNLPGNFNGVNATRTNASSYPRAYAKFLNEVAKLIKSIDPTRPVAVGNVETGLIEYYKKYAPEIDILGVNSYQGKSGFGYLWEEVKEKFDRPIVITEYGADAYFQGKGLDEEAQLEYHRGNMRDIIANQAGGHYEGNAIGGIIFEWVDEWWKDTRGHPDHKQQRKAQSKAPFPDGLVHEEWFGIAGQGRGRNSPFQRDLRKTYYFYQELWSE